MKKSSYSTIFSLYFWDGHKLDKFSQVIIRYLKAQWLSGLKVRLNVAEINLEKFSQINAR
ncbi:hypothetical protein [Globicatella sanguinis]